MRLGWLRFGRRSRAHEGLDGLVAPDNAVSPGRAWLMGGVIVACSAALLGTSDAGSSSPGSAAPSTFAASYLFERKAIEGGFAELTADAPRATFVVTITADALGPDNVVTTQAARASIEAIISATDLAPGADVPNVSYQLRVEGPSTASVLQARDRIADTRELTFSGNCSAPKMGSRCVAHYSFDVWRADDGYLGGTLRVDWTTDLFATATLLTPTGGQFGPLDPPWTVEVAGP
jgi:hypothetical protein